MIPAGVPVPKWAMAKKRSAIWVVIVLASIAGIGGLLLATGVISRRTNSEEQAREDLVDAIREARAIELGEGLPKIRRDLGEPDRTETQGDALNWTYPHGDVRLDILFNRRDEAVRSFVVWAPDRIYEQISLPAPSVPAFYIPGFPK